MTQLSAITVIVAEDELPIRQEILGLLAGKPEFSVIGTAGNGADLKKLLKKGADLALLDIDLPVQNTMDVIAEMDTLPRIIFITAYDNYAVKAFEINAVDFLVKPIAEERFFEALERAKRAINLLSSQPQKKLEALWVREDSFIRPVSVKDVVFLEANDKYTTIHAGREKYSVLKPIRKIFKYLDQNEFMRIHRKYVVNRKFIKSIHSFSGGKYKLALIDDTKLPIGRTFYKEFQSKI